MSKSKNELLELLKELGITEDMSVDEAKARAEHLKELSKAKQKTKFQAFLDWANSPIMLKSGRITIESAISYGKLVDGYWNAIAKRDAITMKSQIPDIHFHEHKHLHVQKDIGEDELERIFTSRSKRIEHGR